MERRKYTPPRQDTLYRIDLGVLDDGQPVCRILIDQQEVRRKTGVFIMRTSVDPPAKIIELSGNPHVLYTNGWFRPTQAFVDAIAAYDRASWEVQETPKQPAGIKKQLGGKGPAAAVKRPVGAVPAAVRPPHGETVLTVSYGRVLSIFCFCVFTADGRCVISVPSAEVLSALRARTVKSWFYQSGAGVLAVGGNPCPSDEELLLSINTIKSDLHDAIAAVGEMEAVELECDVRDYMFLNHETDRATAYWAVRGARRESKIKALKSRPEVVRSSASGKKLL